jgi:L-amino acid N-acyltransferase YncA
VSGAAAPVGAPYAVRHASAEHDAAACAAVYAPYVTDSAASFEEVPPDTRAMAARIEGAHAWLVAEHERDGIVGFAYGVRHQERAAYRWAADVSVYLAAAHYRRGVGRRLYGELFEILRGQGMCVLCAGITQPNAASNAIHAVLGFEPVGTYRRIGWKHGAWHDVMWLELQLRDDSPPPRLSGPPG